MSFLLVCDFCEFWVVFAPVFSKLTGLRFLIVGDAEEVGWRGCLGSTCWRSGVIDRRLAVGMVKDKRRQISALAWSFLEFLSVLESS